MKLTPKQITQMWEDAVKNDDDFLFKALFTENYELVQGVMEKRKRRLLKKLVHENTIFGLPKYN